MMALHCRLVAIGDAMSDQQPPPYPGPHGPPPPYPGPSGQQPSYPGPAAPPPPPGSYGQPPAYGQPPGQTGHDPHQPGYPGYGHLPAYPGHRSAPPKPDSTAKLIGWLIAASALLVGIAACLTWATVDLGPRSFTINGLTGSDIPGDDEPTDGILTLILAIAVLGFAVVRGIGPLQLTAAIIGTVGGALVTLIGIVDIVDVQDEKEGLPAIAQGTVEISIGVGLWLTLAGGILMALISVAGIIKRR